MTRLARVSSAQRLKQQHSREQWTKLRHHASTLGPAGGSVIGGKDNLITADLFESDGLLEEALAMLDGDDMGAFSDDLARVHSSKSKDATANHGGAKYNTGSATGGHLPQHTGFGNLSFQRKAELRKRLLPHRQAQQSALWQLQLNMEEEEAPMEKITIVHPRPILPPV